jgi:hypothetical protein
MTCDKIYIGEIPSVVLEEVLNKAVELRSDAKRVYVGISKDETTVDFIIRMNDETERVIYSMPSNSGKVEPLNDMDRVRQVAWHGYSACMNIFRLRECIKERNITSIICTRNAGLVGNSVMCKV